MGRYYNGDVNGKFMFAVQSSDEQNTDWDLTDLKYALCTTNIEWVYKAVVNFIKKYYA